MIHAVGLGLVSLRYLLRSVPFPADLPNFRVRHDWLVAHATFSSIALIAGPWQLLAAMRKRWRIAHRWSGRVYCGAVLVGWLTSLPIAAHANTGWVASAGFVTLGVAWVGSAIAGYLSIKHGQVHQHREWMIRSYALGCGNHASHLSARFASKRDFVCDQLPDRRVGVLDSQHVCGRMVVAWQASHYDEPPFISV
jgi:hypothetical protein